MEVPISIIQAIVTAAIAFVFRVVFGLINKNEQKSDASDRRIDDSIKEMRQELKELERKFVTNDRELYVQVGEIREKGEYYRGIYESPKKPNSK